MRSTLLNHDFVPYMSPIIHIKIDFRVKFAQILVALDEKKSQVHYVMEVNTYSTAFKNVFQTLVHLEFTKLKSVMRSNKYTFFKNSDR